MRLVADLVDLALVDVLGGGDVLAVVGEVSDEEAEVLGHPEEALVSTSAYQDRHYGLIGVSDLEQCRLMQKLVDLLVDRVNGELTVFHLNRHGGQGSSAGVVFRGFSSARGAQLTG